MALKLGKNFNIHIIMFIFTNNLINYVYFYGKKCVYFYMHLCVLHELQANSINVRNTCYLG